jgi:hypothetical protein
MACAVRGLALVIAMSVLKEEVQSKRVDMASEEFKMIMNASEAELDARLFKISEKTTTGGHVLRFMTLNVEFFTETCDKPATKGIQYCETTPDVECSLGVTKMLCCNHPVKTALTEKCREKKCFDVGKPDSGDKSKGMWEAYKSEDLDMKAVAFEEVEEEARGLLGSLWNVTGGRNKAKERKRSVEERKKAAEAYAATLAGVTHPIQAGWNFHSEPKCVQGARNLLEQVVVQHSPHVVATQEDFENYPLRVPGYVTIISANSHDMWYKDPPFSRPQKTLKLIKKNKDAVHMVNSLLVLEGHFNLAETKAICEGKKGFVFQRFDNTFYRCGIDLRSPEAKQRNLEMLQGTLEAPNVVGWKNDDDKTVERKMPDDADRILLMASRCAALAVVNVAAGARDHIVAASLHLTGGRFDDDLIGLTERYRGFETVQKEEKKAQTKRLMEVLTATKKPSIIMGDFNGPDDFDVQWWNVLKSPWPNTHPFIGSLFGGQEGNDEVLGHMGAKIADWLKMKKESEPRVNHLRLLHTKTPNSFWHEPDVQQAILKTQISKGKLAPLRLESEEGKALVTHALEELWRFEQVYKTWMVGMHEELKTFGWKPLATSQDFTMPFGYRGGTTSKFGGMIDFAYVSPEFLKSETCTLAPEKEVDFSDGEITEKTNVKTCRVAEGTVSRYQVDVVHGVLKRSTDHAPVVFQMTFGAN